LGHFSKRGRLQGYNELIVTSGRASLKNVIGDDEEQGLLGKEEKEVKQQHFQKQVKEKLNYKQDMVPKEGKGKYNITVPVLYDFLKDKKEHKTIRE
jgi:hypothetical protein